jgi:hypothetical protein
MRGGHVMMEACGSEWRNPFLPDASSMAALPHALPTHTVCMSGLTYLSRVREGVVREGREVEGGALGRCGG